METAAVILAILFWVLLALAIVCAMVWTYIGLSLYRMKRENVLKRIHDEIVEKLDEVNNS